MTKRAGSLKAGEQFVADGSVFTVSALPEAERVAGEIHATTPGRGGFWFRDEDEVEAADARREVREVVVDPGLAELASGSPVAVACRDCGARFEGRAYQVTPCPRCGEVDVIEAGRVA